MNSHRIHHRRGTGSARASWATVLLLLLVAFRAPGAEPSVLSDHDAYYPGQDILISFANGPGNTKDWVGLYPVDVVPGTVGSTRWYYVDGTQAGTKGVREGTLKFAGGLALAGDWAAYFLLNDGYVTPATNLFKIVDPGSPLLHASQRVYAPGQKIEFTFSGGPGNPKDWVGVYKAGQTPGSVESTIWNYTDNTQAGTVATPEGTISFATGLAAPGSYVAYFLLNDGYDILASEAISVATPSGTGPRILSVSPANNGSNQPPLLKYSVTITNGTSQLDESSVVLKLDGTAVIPTRTTESPTGPVTFSYTSPSLPQAGSTHVWTFTAHDNAVPQNQLNSEVRTTIGEYRNIVLPAPLFFEDFDAVTEGGLPAGWTGKSFTEALNPDEDLGNLDSATYARWTVVAADRFTGSFVTYSNPDNPDEYETAYQRVLTPNAFNVLNGQVYTDPLAKGRFLFGDSGFRNGRSQVLYVSTPDYNLSGKTAVHLAFKSLWEQNQDSMATVEYSIDQGATWLPIAYLLDSADVLTKTNETTGEISVDVDVTLNTPRGDIAVYTDDSGTDAGGTYGAFVGAPITEDLAPYIQARVNDNTSESKRIELYALPRADNQSKVRVRFGHAGTDSWYFGIDDFGLYSIPTTSEGAHLSVKLEAGFVVLSWPASAAGAVLQSSPTLSPASWTVVPQVSGTTHKVTPSAAAAYYRLQQ